MFLIEFYNAAGSVITVWQSGRPPSSSEKKFPTVIVSYTSFFIGRGKCIDFSMIPCPQRQNSRSLVHVQIHEHLTGQHPIPPIRSNIESSQYTNTKRLKLTRGSTYGRLRWQSPVSALLNPHVILDRFYALNTTSNFFGPINTGLRTHKAT